MRCSFLNNHSTICSTRGCFLCQPCQPCGFRVCSRLLEIIALGALGQILWNICPETQPWGHTMARFMCEPMYFYILTYSDEIVWTCWSLWSRETVWWAVPNLRHTNLTVSFGVLHLFGCPLDFPLWVIIGIKYLKISKNNLDIAQNYPLVNLLKQPFLRFFEKSFRNGP